MCGIIGVFEYMQPTPVDPQRLKSASDVISHRGPDGEGFYFDNQHGIGFGHRRLSIVDVSNGDQPMCNEDGTIWIIFNGEIYNYPELREELLLRGHTFRTHCDTEAIVHAYEEYGDEVPVKLNGIFAFAIWDSRKQKLFLARDHFGVKPLYMADNGKRLVFGSELKAILAYDDSVREMDTTALWMYLNFRYSPAPFALMKNVTKLPASYCCTAEIGKPSRVTRYWQYHLQINHGISDNAWIAALRGKLNEAVGRQLMSDVPLGLSLSGGVDSATLLSIMTSYNGPGVFAFTVGFEGNRPEDNEILAAQEIAATYGAKFHSRMVTEKDYLSFLDNYMWHLEEPIGNDSAAAYYFVAEMAKEHVKVLLNGQGADEPFAGYDRYIGLYYKDRLPLILNKLLFAAVRTMPLGLGRKEQINRLLALFEESDQMGVFVSVSSIITPDIQKRVFRRDAFEFSRLNDIVTSAFENVLQYAEDGEYVEKMLYFDMFTGLAENLLLCEDKMAMAASIEARVPYLDVDYATLALSIPASKKIRNFSGKYIHKQAAQRFINPAIANRRKLGFNNPVTKWLKSNMGDRLMDYVLSSNSVTNQFLSRTQIEKVYQEHKSNQRDHYRFLFQLLSVEQWADTFMKPGIGPRAAGKP